MKYALPALRGVFGSWVYYTSLMPLKFVAKYVSFVKDVHQNHALSDMIQRELKLRRFDDIKEYLITQDDRFLNSMVLAVYDGVPNWFPAGMAEDKVNNLYKIIPAELQNSFGILSFSGVEKIIAVDGQHRLGGIKSLGLELKQRVDLAPVIFVAHDKSDPLKMQKTRRLFTTLNKHAQAVSKNEIIALDENDLMAIVTRRLVEEHNWFSNNRIKVQSGSKISDSDSSLTSIENLYDILTVLFTKILPTALPQVYQSRTGRDLIKMLRNGVRLPDKWLEHCYNDAIEYFRLLGTLFPELGDFFHATTDEYPAITKRARVEQRSIVFRPVGLNIIVNVLANVDGSLEQRFARIASLPKRFDELPYNGLIWSERNGIDEKRAASARNLLLYALKCGEVTNQQRASAMRAYSLITGVETPSPRDMPKSLTQLSSLTLAVQ